MTQSARDGARQLVRNCARVRPGERVLILTSEETAAVGRLIREEAAPLGAAIREEVLTSMLVHGQEPPPVVAAAMLESDVIVCLTPMSLAHTDARHRATDRGARYLSLPQYSMELLGAESLSVDFESFLPLCERLGAMLDAASQIRVCTELGTDLTFSAAGRRANRAPGFVRGPGDLSSPPDVEVNVAPIETSATGRAIIDGSVPCREVGLLQEPIELIFENGRVVRVAGEPGAAQAVTQLFDKFGPKSRVLGEFGIGLNPRAKLCGIMLVDEGALGTVHFGIGSNATIGGQNSVPFHLDFVMTRPTVLIDRAPVINDGILAGEPPVARDSKD